MLTQDNLDRLIKFVGMFGSDHIGEAGNAAMKADKLVKSMGISWADLLTPKLAKPQVNVHVGGKPVNGTAPPPPPPPPQAAPQSNGTRQRHYQHGGTPRGFTMAMHLADFRHKDVARDLIANHAYAAQSKSETDFVSDMAASVFPKLTLRQAAWLSKIAARAGITL